MSMKLGDTDINQLFLGDTEINEAYLGDTLVYSKALSVQFNEGRTIASTLTTYTFSGVDFGDPSSSRRVVVGLSSWQNVIKSIVSVTIGGVAATIHESNFVQWSAGAIASAIVPSGTSGDVVVTWSTNCAVCMMSCYSVYNESNPTPVISLKDTTAPLSLSPTLSDQTAVIALAEIAVASGSFTWGGTLGIVEDDDRQGSSLVHSTASLLTGASGTITATPSSGTVTPALFVVGWE